MRDAWAPAEIANLVLRENELPKDKRIMQVGSELVHGVSHIALRKERVTMGGFIDILNNHVASMRGELFELMDGLVSRVRIAGGGICTGALPPDGTKRCVRSPSVMPVTGP